jgi:hypothetical protein
MKNRVLAELTSTSEEMANVDVRRLVSGKFYSPWENNS